MKGLAPHTLQVFEAVSKLDCIKSYLLVGGTALSLQMGTRQSEDLDFMKWRTSKTEKMEVAWYNPAQRPLPSIMMATCCGMRFCSLILGHKYREKFY